METNEQSLIAANWIEKSITSSFTPFHIEACIRLVDLFAERFPDDMLNKSKLLELIIDKETSINYF